MAGVGRAPLSSVVSTSHISALAFIDDVLDAVLVSLGSKFLHHLNDIRVGSQEGQSVTGVGPGPGHGPRGGGNGAGAASKGGRGQQLHQGGCGDGTEPHGALCFPLTQHGCSDQHRPLFLCPHLSGCLYGSDSLVLCPVLSSCWVLCLQWLCFCMVHLVL